jgi:hypothetical protein
METMTMKHNVENLTEREPKSTKQNLAQQAIPSFYLNRSLHAIVAQRKTCHLELILRLSSKIQLLPTVMASSGVCFD